MRSVLVAGLLILGSTAFSRSPRDGGKDPLAVMDPEIQGEWWIDALRVPEAWRFASGKGITIGDCDSGFYLDEADLSANLQVDLRRDFSDKEHPTEVGDGRFVFHGTAGAAIMTGVRDGVGTNGIAYDSQLVPLQFYNYDPKLDDADKDVAAAACVRYAVQTMQVNVIVLQASSANSTVEVSPVVRDAIDFAVKSGVPVIIPAGNSSAEVKLDEATDTGAIVVGALRQDGRAAGYSNYGSRVNVGAFGEKLNTLYGPNGRMDAFGGTTGAAAQVAATVALMREANPSLAPRALREILAKTARVTSTNARVGGQLDVEAAVAAARQAPFDAAEADELARLRRAAIDVLGAATSALEAVFSNMRLKLQ